MSCGIFFLGGASIYCFITYRDDHHIVERFQSNHLNNVEISLNCNNNEEISKKHRVLKHDTHIPASNYKGEIILIVSDLIETKLS